MRQFIILAIALCLTFTGLFATHPTEGQVLSVIAPSGLCLRAAPGKDSKLLDILEMGDQVRVINSSEITTQKDKIEWTTGSWILVDYNGVEGYVFDGYLTTLPIPTDNYEKSYSLDLIDAFEAWVDINKRLAMEPDTVRKEDGTAKVTYTFESGETMVTKNHENFYKVDVYLNDIRIMDAYNLLQSMLVHNSDREVFSNSTIFIEEHDDNLGRIKINTDNAIVIDKMPGNQIKITMFSPYTGCSL